MTREIIMSFDLFGNSQIEAEGFVGSSCEDATKNYIEALNAKSSDDTRKPEYGLPNTSGQSVGQRW